MTRVCVPTKLVHVPTFVCILPFVLFVLSWNSNRLINQKRYSAYLHLTMGPQVCAVPVHLDPSWGRSCSCSVFPTLLVPQSNFVHVLPNINCYNLSMLCASQSIPSLTPSFVVAVVACR